MKERSPSFIADSLDPDTVFQKLGLSARGDSSGAAYAGQSDAAFRSALEQLGGLYAAFGQFLCWRADLLRTEYLGRLRHIRLSPPAISRADAAAILAAELGEPGTALANALEAEPCWNTLARCAWRAEYRGRAVAVQIARDPVPDADFESFGKGIGRIGEPRLAEAIRPQTLARFREWMRLSDSPSRERSYLEALGASRETSLAQYPELIPELCAGRALCFEWVEGEPVSRRIAEGDAQAARRVAECVLEQICTIAAIDADFDPEAMVITGTGRLAVRRASRLIAIPPPMTHACLKYLAAVLASNAPAAAHCLVQLSTGRPSLPAETRLLDALSNLEPELKINLQFPAAAGVFEGNWRALRRCGVDSPLFVDMMHRNLVAVGYWNAETAPTGMAEDALAEAQWPVLSRMLRARVGEMLHRETASDWLLGSGLLFFELMRQANRVAEGLRENDFSLGVDLEPENNTGSVHRRIRLGVLIGMLLIVFIGCVRFAARTSGAWAGLLSAGAVACGVALFWFVSRFE